MVNNTTDVCFLLKKHIDIRIRKIWKFKLEQKRKHIEQEALKVIQNSKPTYYVIKRSNEGAGFFSNYMWVLGHLMFALEQGLIPVVDMENYPVLYSEVRKLYGCKNAWNYYFENISEISLDDAYASKKYILSEERYLKEFTSRYCKEYGFPTREAVDYYKEYISMLRIKQSVLNILEETYFKLFDGGMTSNYVIGVHYRGTDMKTPLANHFIPASIMEYIKSVEMALNRRPEATIFVSTDEADVINVFKDRFGNKVHYTTSFRSESGEPIHFLFNNRKNHRYLLGLEVLLDAYILSKCDSLICGLSNVSNVAILWNGNRYEKIELIRL